MTQACMYFNSLVYRIGENGASSEDPTECIEDVPEINYAKKGKTADI